MDCREIKDLLDRYIDDDLTKDEALIVKKHLSSCKECGEEFALLKKYRAEMSALKPVKAPADFIKQLNDRIDNQSFLKKSVRYLFFPLKRKLLVEAAGLLAVAVLIALFVNPFKQARMPETAKVADEAAFTEKAPARDREAKIANLAVPAVREGAKSALRAGTEDDRLTAKAKRKTHGDGAGADSVMTREIILALYRAKSEAAPGSFKSMAPQSSARIAEEPADVNAPDLKKDKADGEPLEKGLVVPAKARKAVEAENETQVAQMDKRQLSGAVKFADESSSGRATVSPQVLAIREIVAGLKGRIAEETPGPGGAVKYIVAEIPARSQNELLDKLGKLGIVRSKDNKVAETGKASKIRYKINITEAE